MNIEVKNIRGESVEEIEIQDDVFGVPMNAVLVHQVVVGQLANARQGTAKAKTRSEVSGGGRKPWPQKHTGRSRQGSIRSPLWKGGGVTFGPAPRSYRQRTPKKVRRAAIRMTLSDKVRAGNLIVLESLALDSPKTKDFVAMMQALGLERSVLLVGDGADHNALRAGRNVQGVDMLPADLLNAVDVLNHRTLIMTLDAIRKAEALWGSPVIDEVEAEAA
ncbi:MAG: 50S ribosomal protein L4 [Chloroflexi bacterium]|nr:50S ribosomal protein L4 [Chloroflexota bacterium]